VFGFQGVFTSSFHKFKCCLCWTQCIELTRFLISQDVEFFTQTGKSNQDNISVCGLSSELLAQITALAKQSSK
jgi:hypothetical protein